MADEKPNPREMGRLLALSQVGLEMVAPIVLGYFLDQQLDWSPWGVIAGAALGLFGGLWHLVTLLQRYDKQDSSPRQDSQ